MKRRIWIPTMIAIAAAFFLWKGPSVKSEPPFFLVHFNDFHPESQNFILGLGDEDFQIEVPHGKDLDQIGLREGSFHRERIALDQDGVGTDYSVAKTQTGLYLFEGTGVSYFNTDGTKRFWIEIADSGHASRSLSGPTYPQPDGSVLAFLLHLSRHADEIQLVRFHPEQGHSEVLVSLPEESPNQDLLQRHYLGDGFITTRRGGMNSISTDPAQFYGFDGKPAYHPLAAALTRLHQANIDLHPPHLSPDYGAFYPSQTSAAWGLFPWKDMPGQVDKHLFLLSATDTIQAVPVLCERYSLEPLNSLNFILVHPKLNLFLVGARLNQNDPRIMMYLGRVRKDPAGKVYRAETFRVRYFPQVECPIFSRNGQVLLFAMSDGAQTNLVFSHLSDIVADVNRRYPEAKFDLEELK